MSSEFQPIVTTKLQDIWNLRTLSFRRFQSKRYVFTIRTADCDAKALQIFFNQNDGTLNVNFPYIPRSDGIASIGQLSPFLDKQDVHLEEHGKVTSMKVKYAHKPDGRVHFSQDTKNRTELIKKSIPLSKQDGHVFTLHVQGLSRFEQVQPDKDDQKPTENRTVLNFKFTDKAHSAYKIVGMWHEVVGFLKRSRASNFGPIVNVQDRFGIKTRGFLIGTLVGKPLDNYALLITCQPYQSFDENLDFHFLFIGGFDSPQSPLNPYAKSEFLCIQYPISNFDKLASLLGSMDLNSE